MSDQETHLGAGSGFATSEQPAITIHPAANIFPLVTSGPKYEAFKEGIRVNGQVAPILTYQGQIIDGRTRYQACRELGIEPHFKEWDGGVDLVGLVVNLNLPSRELTPAQRAMSAAKAKGMFEDAARQRMVAGKKVDDPPMNAEEGSEKGEAAEKVAKLFSVGADSVYKAQKVLTKGSAMLQEAVMSGEVSLSAAAKLAERSKDEQDKIVAGGAEAVQAALAKPGKQKNEQKAAQKKAREEGGEQGSPEGASAPAASEAGEAVSEEREQPTPETHRGMASTEGDAIGPASAPSSASEEVSEETCAPAVSEAREEKEEEAEQPTPEAEAGVAPPSDPISIVTDALDTILEQYSRLGFYGLSGVRWHLVGMVEGIGIRMREIQPIFEPLDEEEKAETRDSVVANLTVSIVRLATREAWVVRRRLYRCVPGSPRPGAATTGASP